MSRIQAFFRLVRWPNLLITALMMCLVYHCVMMQASALAFTLLVISMVFVVAGGYVINDIFDKEIDAVNKAEKLIVGKIFSEKQCRFFYWTLTIIGLGCALMSSIMALGSGFLTIFACMLLLTCILYSYSERYKKKLVIGNLIVSLSIAFAVFLPWLFEMLYMSKHELLLVVNESLMKFSLRFVLVYAVFAFLSTLMREIIKDMEDHVGDARSHCRTIPIVFGMKTAKVIVFLLGLLTFLIVFYAGYVVREQFDMKVVCYLLMFSGLLIFYVGLSMFFKETNYRLSSNLLKISMIIGILSMLFIG